MTNPGMRPNDIISALKDGLETDLELTRVDLAESNKVFQNEKGEARFLMADRVSEPIHFVAAKVHECKVHGLVVCHTTQTIGLIQIVSVDSSKQQTVDEMRNELRTTVHRHVREAVALRHELLQKRSHEKIPFNVELVLVASESTAIEKASNVLQEFIQKSSYLHSIGVSIFVDSNRNGFRDKGNLRRIFPWMLQSVRAWYNSATFQEKVEPPKGARKTVALGDAKVSHGSKLTELRLKNFRLQGERRWQLDPQHHLHVIHGNNGTGKSTFTESIELLLTGKLDKLEMGEGLKRRYVDVLKNSKVDSSQDATLSASFDGKQPTLEWKVISTGIEFTGKKSQLLKPDSPQRVDIEPGGFRYEQQFADNLVRVSEGGRATEFLKAFFPGTKTIIDSTQKAKKEFEKKWKELPTGIKQRLLAQNRPRVPKPKVIESKLSNLKKSLNSLQELDLIPKVDGLIQQCVEFQICDPPENKSLSEYDRVWQQVVSRAHSLKNEVEEVLQFAEELNEWTVRADVRTSSETTVDLMVNWLETMARCDLLEKETGLLSFIHESKRTESEFLLLGGHAINVTGGDNSEGVRVEAQKATLQKELEKKAALFSELLADVYDENDSSKGKTGPKPAPKLNERIRYWFSQNLVSDTSLSVAQQLETAFQNNEKVNFQLAHGEHKKKKASKNRIRVKVGEKNGAEALANYLTGKLNVLKEVIQSNADLPLSLEEVYVQANEFLNAAKNYEATKQESLAEFSRQISPEGDLGKAVNELTALFTPAQWAYDDVESTVNADGGMGITVRGNGGTSKSENVHADLRLNTAELNTLALVLFLLCAPDQRNSLKMLVLDDPFQNMDELTVTTVARGISRLFAVWKRYDQLADWSMTILLHGEENLERLRRECYCKAYFLPWLTPHSENGDPPKITEDHPRYTSAQADDLEGFLEIRPTP